MQDTGANLSSVAATVSLLLLIVAELASFTRNEIDGPREVVGAPILFGIGNVNCLLGEVITSPTLSGTSKLNCSLRGVVSSPTLSGMSNVNCWLRKTVRGLILFGMSNLKCWPSLGRLAAIHTVNHVILTVSMSLIFSISGRPVSIALLIITFLIGLTLPMLEVGEYQEIRRAEVFPLSVILNGCTVIVTTAFSISWLSNVKIFLSIAIKIYSN